MSAITSETSLVAVLAPLPTLAIATASTFLSSVAATALANNNNNGKGDGDGSGNNIISLHTLNPLERRLQSETGNVLDNDTGGGAAVRGDGGGGGVPGNAAGLFPSLPSLTNMVMSSFLPTNDATKARTNATASHLTAVAATTATRGLDSGSISYPTFRPPSIESLVASSAEDLNNFRDVSFDVFDDDDDLFGSPLAFDASENGLWNGRFVPPPPRPPFFVDEPVLSDGLTTCDLCSWAMPTKSTFIFEGTIEKASELGWPLTLIIVSVLSALLGAIVMVTVVRCRRKKASNNRNETHVQWWSRNKRPNGSNNNNHLRRSNIYTAHPADSIRGLQQPSLSAASSLTTMTAMGATAPSLAAVGAVITPGSAPSVNSASVAAQQQFYHPFHPHAHQHSHQLSQGAHQLALHHSSNGHGHGHGHKHRHGALELELELDMDMEHHDHGDCTYEHEYHQPQELQLQLQHQRQHSSSMSSLSAGSPTPTMSVAKSLKPVPMQLQHQPLQHQQPQQQKQQQQQQQILCDDACHWPNTTIVVAS